MSCVDRRLSRRWSLVPAAALTASGCERDRPPNPSAILKAVLASVRTAEPITDIVVDADVPSGDLQAAAGLPQLRTGPAELDRDTRSLKPGGLAVVGLRVNGRKAEVDTRSVSAHTHRPGATLDCGTAQTFLFTQDTAGRRGVSETRITQC